MNLAIISQSPVPAPHHRPFSFPKRYQLSELIICRLQLAEATGEDRSVQGGSGQDLAGQAAGSVQFVLLHTLEGLQAADTDPLPVLRVQRVEVRLEQVHKVCSECGTRLSQIEH